jgi:hypothetical protein
MQIDQTNLTPQAGIAKYVHEGGPSISGTDTDWSKKLDSMEVAATGSVYISDATYLRPGQEQEEKSVAERIDSESGQSAQARSNQIAVIANTTSEEDLAKMQEDGYSLTDTDSRTIVTVTDKIKAALAKAGVDVSMFGDTLSKEELAEITGSEAVATKIEQELKQNDLPLSDDNLEDCRKAFEQAQQIDTPDDSAVRYLVQNELPPTIENLYKAEHSTSDTARFTENRLSDEDFSAMEVQVEKIITDAGLTADEQTKADSRWLIENGLPLTGGNLAYVNQLRNLTPQNSGDTIAAMGEAIAEGGRAVDAMLVEGYTLADQAQEAMDVVAQATDVDLEYLIAKGQELTIANLKVAEANRGQNADSKISEGNVIEAEVTGLADGTTAGQDVDAAGQAATGTVDETGLKLLTAKRQLEETRLAMTTEANYALLKKGISIDTKPLEELVEDLKNQEKNYYKELLEQSGIEAGDEKVSAFAKTTEVLMDLKGYPANILNPYETEDTLNTLHESGRILKDTYTKANESYEALMTSPRPDLGDSIGKAFTNVDDILSDLNLETSEANRRAVRILAYNEIDITTENISLMKAKDEEVQRVFSNMTPQVTMEMIRNDQNPLDMELSDLNRAAEEIKSQNSESDNERFSKYLWKLEQNQEITEDERESYIGIYRLIAQVEKTDGAAIGALVNEGAKLTMRNLLSAVRTGKSGRMDYRVDDEFAGVESHAKNARIDDQIMAAFQQNCLHDAMEEITPQAASVLSEMDWEELTPEQLKEALQQAADENAAADSEAENAYLQEQMSELTEAMEAPDEVYAYLERTEVPNTVTNILAVEQMMRNPNQMFETLFRPKGASEDRLAKVEELKEQVLEQFGEAVKTPEELADAQEALAETAEHVMDDMILEDKSVNSLDLRALRLATRQFTLCAQQTKEECYMIPMQTGDSVTGVSLKIIRGEEKKGFVDILFRGDTMGKVAASFEAKENGISGMIATDDEQTRQLLADNAGMLAGRLQEEGSDPVDLRVAYVPDLSLEHYSSSQEKRNAALLAKDTAQTQDDSKAQDSEAKDPVQTRRLYHIAESFIGAMKELE